MPEGAGGLESLQFGPFDLPALDIWTPRVDALMYAFCTRGCHRAGCHPPLSTDPVAFPALAEDAFESEDDPHGEFVFGLARVLDGINTTVRERLP
jgi:hypothetical protein